MLKHLERSFEDDEVTGENMKEQYPNQPQISDHLCRILIIGSSGSGKKKYITWFNKSPTRYWQNVYYAEYSYDSKGNLLIKNVKF